MSTKPYQVVLRRQEVESRTGLARATIYSLCRQGKFPKPFPLTESGRAVGWLESDIETYLQNRINAACANTALGAR